MFARLVGDAVLAERPGALGSHRADHVGGDAVEQPLADLAHGQPGDVPQPAAQLRVSIPVERQQAEKRRLRRGAYLVQHLPDVQARGPADASRCRLRIGQPVRPDPDQIGGRRLLQRPPRRVEYLGPRRQAGADRQSRPRAQAGDDDARAPPDLPGRARPVQPEPPGVIPGRAVLAEVDRGAELRLRAVPALGDPPHAEVESRGVDLVVRRAQRARPRPPDCRW